jgi:hypothetical protein
MDLQSTVNALGGQAGVDAIYAQLGGKEKVMEMLKSGQGLPPGFQMPAAITNLGTKVTPATSNMNSYDYEYYDPDTGDVLTAFSPQTLTQYPAVPPPSTILPQQQQRATPSAPSPPQSDKDKAAGILNAVGGQTAINQVFDSLGGPAGIEAIYDSLGGRDAVMKMIQSGQGLPANFKLPPQLTALSSKLAVAAKEQKGATQTEGGYDYEYYYVDEAGTEIVSGTASTTPVSPPPAVDPISQSVSRVSSPVAPATPLFAPPNPSFVAGGGSLFEFLEQEEEVTLPKKSVATSSSPVKPPVADSTPSSSSTQNAKGKKTAAPLSNRLAAAQNRVIGGR